MLLPLLLLRLLPLLLQWTPLLWLLPSKLCGPSMGFPVMKKFALLATVVLFVAACGTENTEATEQQAKEAEAMANDLLDKMNAAMDSATAAVDSTTATATEAVEEVQEAAH